MTNTKNNAEYRPNVGIMLINANGHIWVGSRNDYVSEYWQMPQGGVDDGEDLEMAMWRELGEEIGVHKSDCEILAKTADWVYYDLPPDLIKSLWGGQYKGQRQMWYALKLKSPDSVINIETEEPEFKAWKWLSADKLVATIVPFKREVYEIVLNEFKGYVK